MSFPVKHLRIPFNIKTKKKETPNSFEGISNTSLKQFKTLKLQGQSHLPSLEEKSGINKISTVKEISRFFFDKKTRSTSPPKENSMVSEDSQEKKTNIITNFDKIILVEKFEALAVATKTSSFLEKNTLNIYIDIITQLFKLLPFFFF